MRDCQSIATLPWHDSDEGARYQRTSRNSTGLWPPGSLLLRSVGMAWTAVLTAAASELLSPVWVWITVVLSLDSAWIMSSTSLVCVGRVVV